FGGVTDASFTHITSRGNPYGILDAGDVTDSNSRLVFAANIVERKDYGIGTGADEGEKTLTRNFPAYSYDKNVLVNTSAGPDQSIADASLERRSPPGTWVVSSWDAVGIDPASSRLTPTSRFRKAAADGKDVGVDIDALATAQRDAGGSAPCVASGVRPRGRLR